MAKKQKINILQLHMEKIALAVSIIIVGVVVFFRFVKTSGVELNGRKLKPSVAAKQAAQQAQQIQQSLKKPDNKKLPVYKPVASRFIKDQYKVLQVAETPLTPPLSSGGALEKRTYQIPAIPDIQDVKVEFTRALAKMPSNKALTNNNNDVYNVGFGRGYTEKDLDFVTVEGTFPMAELYKLFKDSFGPGVKDPLDIYEPVVAYVQLRRQYLKDDGTWSEPQLVPRLSVDPMSRVEIPLDELNKLSPTAFQVKIGDRHNYNIQLALLQPKPYSLVNKQWFPPDQKGKQSQGNNRNRRGYQQNQNRQIPGMGMPGMGMPGMGMPGMGMPGEGMPGMGIPGGGMPGGYPGGMSRPSELKSDSLSFWAHDGNVQPDRYYKYSIRLGFFNPVAGHDWVTAQQKDLKDQRVLWSAWAECGQLVRVPPRTIFFPKASGVDAQGSMRAEVYHRQGGKWYRRSFPYVLPAVSIGGVVEEKAPVVVNRNANLIRRGFGGRPNPQNRFGRGGNVANKQAKPVKVDYRTGAMVIDIKQSIPHWFGQPSRLAQITCPDLIYMGNDGSIHRLPSDKNGWTMQRVQDQLRINRIIKEEAKRQQSKMQRRGFNNPRGGYRGFNNPRGGIGMPGMNRGRPQRVNPPKPKKKDKKKKR